MSSTLILIRHGESVSNKNEGRSSDPETIELTDLGRHQATKAANSLSEQPGLIVVSRMHRAKQSAEPLQERFPLVPVEQWDVHEFVYINLQFEKPQTREERKPRVDAYWRRCNPAEKNPDAESFEELWERVISFHKRASNHPADCLVVVTHGFFISAFIWGMAHGFPRCSSEVMADVFEESIQNHVPNSALVRFELTRLQQ